MFFVQTFKCAYIINSYLYTEVKKSVKPRPRRSLSVRKIKFDATNLFHFSYVANMPRSWILLDTNTIQLHEMKWNSIQFIITFVCSRSPLNFNFVI